MCARAPREGAHRARVSESAERVEQRAEVICIERETDKEQSGAESAEGWHDGKHAERARREHPRSTHSTHAQLYNVHRSVVRGQGWQP